MSKPEAQAEGVPGPDEVSWRALDKRDGKCGRAASRVERQREKSEHRKHRKGKVDPEYKSSSSRGADAYPSLGHSPKSNITRTEHSRASFMGCLNALQLICIALCLTTKIHHLRRAQTTRTAKRVTALVVTRKIQILP
jgi:hypothetical protein